MITQDPYGKCPETKALGSAVVLKWGVTPTNQALMIHDVDETFTTPHNKNVGNSLNNNTFNTNSLYLDAPISTIMAREIQQLRKMISSIPRIVQPISKVTSTSHRISRFNLVIVDTKIPKSLPNSQHEAL